MYEWLDVQVFIYNKNYEKWTMNIDLHQNNLSVILSSIINNLYNLILQDMDKTLVYLHMLLIASYIIVVSWSMSRTLRVDKLRLRFLKLR